MSSTGEQDVQAWREPNELDLGALHVQFALRTASELPRYLEDPGLPPTVQIACLESLLTNLRLLLEFTVRGQTKRDIHRSQYLPHWQPEHTEELHERAALAVHQWPCLPPGTGEGRGSTSHRHGASADTGRVGPGRGRRA